VVVVRDNRLPDGDAIYLLFTSVIVNTLFLVAALEMTMRKSPAAMEKPLGGLFLVGICQQRWFEIDSWFGGQAW
jgi:hypothetical protein